MISVTDTASSGKEPEPQTWAEWINWLWVALAITCVYIGWLVCKIGWDKLIGFINPETPLNNIGDFIAGAFAPIAVIWLVAAVLTQRQELLETRKQFKKSQGVIEQQLGDAKIGTQAQNDLAYETANTNYKLALFDRRIAIYDRLNHFAGNLIYQGEVTDEQRAAFYKALGESRHYYPESVLEYLKEVDEHVTKLWRYNFRIRNRIEQVKNGARQTEEKQAEHEKNVELASAEEEWLYEKLKADEMNKVFLPHLNLPNEITLPESYRRLKAVKKD